MRIRPMAVADLTPADYNPREIGDKAMAGLEASISEFGLVEPIVWNERTGNVVGGHQRLRVIQASGEQVTDVVVVDVPLGREKAMNVALNNPHITGDYSDSLQGLLEEIAGDDSELFESVRLDELLLPEALDDDIAPEAPKDPVTKLGDTWLLGKHRLHCGDSTDEASVLLAHGELDPWIMVTDPPYGVDYDPEWRNRNFGGEGRSTGVVANDGVVDWSDSWRLFDGDVAYVWHGQHGVGATELSLVGSAMIPRTLIIWKKRRMVVSRGHYHGQFESAWYAVRKGKTSRWCGDRSQSCVWELDALDGEERSGHGTQKPIECMARPIRNHGGPGDVVYDPFLGSGTTLIAADQLDRICVGLEIDPAYCDVIIERWESLTGGKAKRA